MRCRLAEFTRATGLGDLSSVFYRYEHNIAAILEAGWRKLMPSPMALFLHAWKNECVVDQRFKDKALEMRVVIERRQVQMRPCHLVHARCC